MDNTCKDEKLIINSEQESSKMENFNSSKEEKISSVEKSKRSNLSESSSLETSILNQSNESVLHDESNVEISSFIFKTPDKYVIKEESVLDDSSKTLSPNTTNNEFLSNVSKSSSINESPINYTLSQNNDSLTNSFSQNKGNSSIKESSNNSNLSNTSLNASPQNSGNLTNYESPNVSSSNNTLLNASPQNIENLTNYESPNVSSSNNTSLNASPQNKEYSSIKESSNISNLSNTSLNASPQNKENLTNYESPNVSSSNNTSLNAFPQNKENLTNYKSPNVSSSNNTLLNASPQNKEYSSIKESFNISNSSIKESFNISNSSNTSLNASSQNIGNLTNYESPNVSSSNNTSLNSSPQKVENLSIKESPNVFTSNNTSLNASPQNIENELQKVSTPNDTSLKASTPQITQNFGMCENANKSNFENPKDEEDDDDISSLSFEPKGNSSINESPVKSPFQEYSSELVSPKYNPIKNSPCSTEVITPKEMENSMSNLNPTQKVLFSESKEMPRPLNDSLRQKEEESLNYNIKWIHWNGKLAPILMQNRNGPCPIISITNVLLLRHGFKTLIKEGDNVIGSHSLLEYLANALLSSRPDISDISPSHRLDFEANMNDALSLLPSMFNGLDVNVKFTGVKDFEYTSECIIYDLLNIPLYHGWLLDPSNDVESYSVIQSLSYNQLVEKIIRDKGSEDSVLLSQALSAQQFLENSASQLTYHGLCELNSTMKNEEIGVFFRNNHFSTIIKHNHSLFLLVTDEGFIKETKVTWETLDSVDGDVQFYDDYFEHHNSCSVNPPPPPFSSSSAPSFSESHPNTLDSDHCLAMSLQNEMGSEGDLVLSDEELAKRLQDEENNLVREAKTTDETLGKGSKGVTHSKNKTCLIL